MLFTLSECAEKSFYIILVAGNCSHLRIFVGVCLLFSLRGRPFPRCQGIRSSWLCVGTTRCRPALADWQGSDKERNGSNEMVQVSLHFILQIYKDICKQEL